MPGTDARGDGPCPDAARIAGSLRACSRGRARATPPERGRRLMQLYLRLLQCLRPYWGRVVAAAICSGLVAAFTGAYAWLVRPALDEVFINRNETWLILLPVALIAVSALKGMA